MVNKERIEKIINQSFFEILASLPRTTSLSGKAARGLPTYVHHHYRSRNYSVKKQKDCVEEAIKEASDPPVCPMT